MLMGVRGRRTSGVPCQSPRRSLVRTRGRRGVHLGRTSGGHCDHCHSDCPAAAGDSEGTRVGSAWLTGVAPGDKYELGFGPIEGLRLKRDEPKRSQGDRGIISSSTQIAEEAVLKIENLTDESWPVKLMDQVPYSEQEDLEISFTADPKPSETDVDGQRGVLAWTFDLPAGEKKEVTLNSLISWPSGKVLQ